VAGVLRAIARVCLSAIFITSGFDMARDPGARAKKAAQELPGLPEPELVARLQGATMVISGTALALHIKPALAAGALALSLIPVTYVGHPFWKEEDPAARRGQTIHFLKNLGLFGGLVVVAVDGKGR
jgi:putative oxidoreductase